MSSALGGANPLLARFHIGLLFLLFYLFLWRLFDSGEFSQQPGALFRIAPLAEELLLEQVCDHLVEFRPAGQTRSEERRVGKEGRARGAADDDKKRGVGKEE